MGTTLSEPCIYDKLSESIDILRQSGYRYGMSEREIEKFIKQVLETNEPRREPPQFPILRATIKVGILFLQFSADPNSFYWESYKINVSRSCSTAILHLYWLSWRYRLHPFLLHSYSIVQTHIDVSPKFGGKKNIYWPLFLS